MKLRTSLLLAVSLGSAVAFGLPACGSSDSGAGGGGGGDTTPTTLKHPPPVSDSASDGDGSDVVYAVKTLSLGDVDASGNASSSAWKTLGYDIDGKASTNKSTDVCKPAGNGTASVHNNGAGGIDNSFGSNILPIITGLISNPSDEVNKSITDGKFTVLLKLGKLGSKSDYKNLPAAVLAGGGLDSPPVWDGSDKWPVFCEILNGCALPSTKGDINDPKVKFPTSYVANNTWVSGSKGDLTLSIAIQGVSLDLVIHQAVITADLSADRKSASKGVISGILTTQQLVDTIKSVVGRVQPSLCGSQTVESILPTIIGASDIMQDGSQSASGTCDGISIGIGFEAAAAQLGDVTDPSQPTADPCADGGVPEAGDDAAPTDDAAADAPAE